MPADPSTCLSCGACCSHFRVSFYWQEAEQRGIDPASVSQISPWQVCFRGTGEHPVRCVNLEGDVGREAACRIYDQRPTPCRSVEIGDEKCDQARVAHGLLRLTGS
jgi:hypothetical protein